MARPDFDTLRRHLIARLQADGTLRDPRVTDALLAIPRELFLDPSQAPHANTDQPLGIGVAQTISAPHMVAIMTEALDLQPGHRVLEVGAGSGYHAAVTAHLVHPATVHTIETRPYLVQAARKHLDRAGIQNVEVHEGDGGSGWPPAAPYDRIYLTCAAPQIPRPLLDQLAPDGLLLAPIGGQPARLKRYHRTPHGLESEDLGACAFVPLVGPFGAPQTPPI